MNRKAVLLLAVWLLLLAVPLFAQGKVEDTGVVTLDWWVGAWQAQEHPDERQAYDFEAYFEKKYPNINLNVVPIAWEGMQEKFALAARTNNLPHIMDSEDFLGWTAEFASYGHVMDLTDFINKEVGAEKWRVPQVLENASYKGKIWAFPYRNSTRVLLWNKDMFKAAGLDPEKPPQTWAEFIEMGKKLTYGDQYGFSFPAKRDCTVAPEYLRTVMNAFGADITDPAITKSTINTPEAKQAIRMWTDMVTKDKIVPRDVISSDDNEDIITFGSQTTAMCLAGPWSVDTLRIQFPDLNYGVALIPSNEKGVPGKFGLISMGWVVRKDVTAAEKEAIFTVLKEIINPDVNIWFTDSLPVAANFPQNGVNPSTGRVINFVDDPKYQVWLEQLKHTYPSALLHPVGPRMAVEVNTAIERIILGEDLDKVLAETDKIINDMLKSY